METPVYILLVIVLCGTFLQNPASPLNATMDKIFQQLQTEMAAQDQSIQQLREEIHRLQRETTTHSQRTKTEIQQLQTGMAAKEKSIQQLQDEMKQLQKETTVDSQRILTEIQQLQTVMADKDKNIQQQQDDILQRQKETTAEGQRTQAEIQQLKTEMTAKDTRIQQQQDDIDHQAEKAAKDQRIQALEQRNYIERCESGVLSTPYNVLDSGLGTRYQDMTATFSKPFRTTPVVTIGLMQLDICHVINTRVTSDIMSKSTTGLTVRIGTWADTELHVAGVYWMACA